MSATPSEPDQRPLMVAVVGPGGAARTVFARDFARSNQLPFVDAHLIAQAHKADAAEVARLARQLCDHYIAQAESFLLVTTLCDPAGEEVEFFRRLWNRGYKVAVCFIGLNCSEEGDEGAALSVAPAGYDLPAAKPLAHPRTLDNLARAAKVLPCVLVYDNTTASEQVRLVAEYREGVQTRTGEVLPSWFEAFVERLRTP